MTFMVPRNYVSNLEAQVASLTQELQELRAQSTVPRGSSASGGSVQNGGETTASPEYQHWMSSSLGRVVLEPSNQPHFFGLSSGITLARLVMAALRIEDLPSPLLAEQQPSHSITGSYSAVSQASLPPRHAAEHLIEVYFQYRTPHLPIIERARAEQAVESAYATAENQQAPDRDSSKHLFTTYMIFAIALCNIPHPSGGRPPESEECFHSAIGEINKVFVSSRRGIDSLMALLLLSQYVALCPSKGSLWLLTGTALRLAIDLGMHWETEDSKLRMDPEALNERRRLWWSAYFFDRILCITLGRPFGMADQGITVEFPRLAATTAAETAEPTAGYALHAVRSHNSLFSLAQLESEIKHVLYSHWQGSSLAYPRADYVSWIGDIKFRLKDWYDTLPAPREAHPSSIFASQSYWDAIYNNALLLLYRPSPIVPEPTLEALRISFEASCKVITCVKTLHRERKIDIMWKWVHHLFMAGLTVLYCLWHSTELRELTEANISISMLQSCASSLSALSERWDGASGCRDAFETLSSATIDWLITANAEETRQSRLEFEKHLQDLHQQLPPSFSGEATISDPFALLSTGTFTFGFGESLNMAAEWPALQAFDFNDLSVEAILEPRADLEAFREL